MSKTTGAPEHAQLFVVQVRAKIPKLRLILLSMIWFSSSFSVNMAFARKKAVPETNCILEFAKLNPAGRFAMLESRFAFKPFQSRGPNSAPIFQILGPKDPKDTAWIHRFMNHYRSKYGIEFFLDQSLADGAAEVLGTKPPRIFLSSEILANPLDFAPAIAHEALHARVSMGLNQNFPLSIQFVSPNNEAFKTFGSYQTDFSLDEIPAWQVSRDVAVALSRRFKGSRRAEVQRQSIHSMYAINSMHAVAKPLLKAVIAALEKDPIACCKVNYDSLSFISNGPPTPAHVKIFFPAQHVKEFVSAWNNPRELTRLIQLHLLPDLKTSAASTDRIFHSVYNSKTPRSWAKAEALATQRYAAEQEGILIEAFEERASLLRNPVVTGTAAGAALGAGVLATRGPPTKAPKENEYEMLCLQKTNRWDCFCEKTETGKTIKFFINPWIDGPC